MKVKADSEFVRGVEAAAYVISDYNRSTTHSYRLDDCVLCKLNVTRRKRPRRNLRKLQHPDDAWVCGFATALAEVHRMGGITKTDIRLIAHVDGALLTLVRARKAGVPAFDLKELKRAGIAVGRTR